MGKVRVDVTGYGDEFSQHVDVDTDRVVSSIKVNVADHEVTVYYKRSETDNEPLLLDETGDEAVAETDDEVTALTGVVAPVNEVATLEKTNGEVKDLNENDLDEKGTAKSRTTSRAVNGKTDNNKNSAVDPDGNTAKVKNDETLPDT